MKYKMREALLNGAERVGKEVLGKRVLTVNECADKKRTEGQANCGTRTD